MDCVWPDIREGITPTETSYSPVTGKRPCFITFYHSLYYFLIKGLGGCVNDLETAREVFQKLFRRISMSNFQTQTTLRLGRSHFLIELSGKKLTLLLDSYVDPEKVVIWVIHSEIIASDSEVI